jgi:hypothetical protein
MAKDKSNSDTRTKDKVDKKETKVKSETKRKRDEPTTAPAAEPSSALAEVPSPDFKPAKKVKAKKSAAAVPESAATDGKVAGLPRRLPLRRSPTHAACRPAGVGKLCAVRGHS